MALKFTGGKAIPSGGDKAIQGRIINNLRAAGKGAQEAVLGLGSAASLMNEVNSGLDPRFRDKGYLLKEEADRLFEKIKALYNDAQSRTGIH